MANERKSKMDGLVQRAIHSAIFTCLCLLMTFVFTTDLHAGNSYTITATAGSGGSISPSGAVSVRARTNQAFNITPNTGYHVANVTVDGVSQGAITSYIFYTVTANHTISATFAPSTYTITPSAGSGGTISPSSPVVVNYGGSQTFTIAPNTGYHIADVKVDNVSQGAISSYPFTNVNANHTIVATFAINPYTLTATAGGGGTVTPTAATVYYGGSQSFTIAPNTGYHIADVKVDNVSQGAITSYSFTNVAANHTLAATFAPNTYSITATAGNGGSISPAGTLTVSYGATQSFTITPNSGYNYVNVTVDGVSKGAITSYTFTNVTANHTIAAIFAINAPPSQSSANYFYDDLGRLTRVVQGTSGVVYTYDGVGNLVSTESAATTNGSPVLSAVNPNVLSVGSSMLVTLTGQNLLTTQTVTSVNGLLAIRTLSVTDTRITAEITAQTAGSDSIKVTTLNGTATIGITLSSFTLTLSPGQLAIVPGGTGSLTATISPPLTTSLTLNLLSSNPVIATVQQSVTIPANTGSANFTVNGLQLGYTNISAGGPFAVVFVSNPFSHDENGDSYPVRAQSISVIIDAPAGTTPTTATPVSVGIDAPVGTTPTTARPVSVGIDAPVGTTPTTAKPVSVGIDAPTGTTPTTAVPVSVGIDSPAGTSPTVSGGVSVKIQ